MKELTMNKKKRHILLIAVIAIFVVFAGMLVGCGNQNAESTINEVESTEEPTDVPTSEPTSTPTTEPERETIQLSADEYYVDYPLSLEDGRQVYVKILPNLSFYPEATDVAGMTCLERYNTDEYFSTALSVKSNNSISEAYVSYEIDNDYTYITWCTENQNTFDWTYEVSEPEDWGNGITAYKVDMFINGDDRTTDYALYYRLDDKYTVLISISGFLGTPYLLENGELKEEHEKVLEFYRTEEDLFVVVDPEMMDVVTSAPTSEPTEVPETTEEPEATSEPTPAPTTKPEPTEKPSEPTPAPVAPTEPPHTHNYNSSVTNATCTTDGYTTYTCNCGDSYTTPISATGHSYVNGDCHCGAHDPNYVPPHTHSWATEEWQERVAPFEDAICVFYCGGCGAEFATPDDVSAHQATTGKDGEWKHTGWSNGVKYIELFNYVTHHRRVCACGAIENID